jgi:pyruvate-formate lyase-activating enzyme
MNDLEFKKTVLDNLSQSFCAAKWYNATIWLGSGQTTSCHHPLPHAISELEIAVNPRALHNTGQKKLERQQMQRGERPTGCEYCWKIEDMGSDAISDRVYKSKIYPIQDLYGAINTYSNEDVNLRTLEISFDRTCQFACGYCNPAFSSTWVKDIKQNGPYKNLVSDGRHHFTHTHDGSQLYRFGESNPYVDAFFRWWESDLHTTLDELRITGGEPLMSGYTWQLLDWFKNNRDKSKTRLAINTNLGMEFDVVQRLVESCEGIDLDIYTSNESMHAHAEYQRDGLIWEQWEYNLRQLIELRRLRGVHVMCTVNALCLDTLPEFLTYLMTFKSSYGTDFPNFTLNILRFPSFQSVLVLPDTVRMHHRNRLQQWLDLWERNVMLQEHERNHVQRLIDYLDVVKTPHSGAAQHALLQQDFKRFYTQYDNRRNKDFVKTFASLAEWYDSIQV